MSAARLSSAALAAFAAAAAWAFAGSAGGLLPPLTVAVKPAGDTDAAVVMPVEFTAPLEASAFSPEAAHYIVGPDGELFACQVEQFGEPAADAGYRWARFRALAPLVERTYQVLESHSRVRPNVPLVGAFLSRDEAVLDSGVVKAAFDPAAFTLVRGVQVRQWQAVPEYLEEVVNRQQSARLVVTDRFRRADFTLAAKLNEGGFRLDQMGPVAASVVYQGAFAGPGGIDDVPYSATVSLLANHVLHVAVRVPPGAVDEEAWQVKSLTVTLPLLLSGASRVTFGGTHEYLKGLERWQGQSRLKVAGDGAYEFADAEGSPISGGGPVTWVHYGDGDGGVSCLWGGDGAPVEFRVVEYDEDLLSLAVTPVRLEDGSYEASASFLFSVGGLNAKLVGSCALALAHPAAATVSQAYIQALTKAR